ncbi:uncharacterized protein LOC110707491 [Chenopodium quinoa]|uniref:uncharacterized protein LOC110707491 n=1 Tax=Chenopodium quinoa TaxID=63459 RepID=UPI000B78DDA3|nr:uncharacterized protein LOC110707491 [Chenopodium quinoa]
MAHICLMAKTDEKAKLQEYEDECIDIQEDLKELHMAKTQRDKALDTYKEHSEWMDNMRFDIQNRFCSLFYDNMNLKENLERLKPNNTLLNVELSLFKISEVAPNSEVPLRDQYSNFLEDLKMDKANLKGNLKELGRKPMRVLDTKFFIQVPVRGNNTCKCKIIHNDIGNTILEGTHKGNKYIVDLNEVPNSSLTCLIVIKDDPLLWHKTFGHASFTLLDKLRSKELVEGLPCIKFLYDKVFHACVKGLLGCSFLLPKMKRFMSVDA